MVRSIENIKKNGSRITSCYSTAQIPNGLDNNMNLVVVYVHAKHAVIMEARLKIFVIVQYHITR